MSLDESELKLEVMFVVDEMTVVKEKRLDKLAL
jgi:hypothetical protein